MSLVWKANMHFYLAMHSVNSVADEWIRDHIIDPLKLITYDMSQEYVLKTHLKLGELSFVETGGWKRRNLSKTAGEWIKEARHRVKWIMIQVAREKSCRWASARRGFTCFGCAEITARRLVWTRWEEFLTAGEKQLRQPWILLGRQTQYPLS